MSHQSSFPPMHSAGWWGLPLSEKRGLPSAGWPKNPYPRSNKQTNKQFSGKHITFSGQ